MDRDPAPDPYRRLFETEVDGAVVLDATTGLILATNQAAAKIFGFGSPQEMVGLNPLDYVADEDRQPVALLLAHGLEVNRPNPAEIRMKTRDGRAIWVSAATTLIEHEGKKASLIAIREITSEKAKDAALKEAERQYERLFDGMLDGAVVLDVSTFQIVLANKAAADAFGFSSPREIVGENPLSYIPEEDRDGVTRLIALNLDGKATNPAELRVITRDKRERWISATATKVDYDGRTAILSTLRDITSEKAKDAALRATEEGKLRLIDAASEAITIVQDGKLAYVNPALAKGAGISQQQLIGISFMDLVHPDERQAVSERYERILAGEWFSEAATIKGVNAKGQTLWSEIREIPFAWQGRPAIMSLIHDVTDRVLAEEERKEKEERLRAIVENAWDGVIIFDENYVVLFESPSLSRMTGYTPEEWKGISPAQWPIHPDDLPSMLTRLEYLRSRPGSTVADIRMRLRHKDGSWRTFEATSRNLLQDPKVKGLVANFRDITEYVKAQEALKASEERFRTLIERATDVVIVLDAGGKITYQSPSLERVTGFGPNEWVDRSLGELLIHPDDLPSLATLLERILTQPGATVEGVTARYQHKDGSWHTLEATVTNMLHDPKVSGLVANFRDVTDRKEAAEALKRSEALLSATQQLAGVGGWEYDVQNGKMAWTDETYHIHEIPKVPTIDHVNESLKCYPPAARQVIEQAFQRCIEEGIPYDLELPFVTFGGNQRWIRTTAKAIREGNRIVRVLGNIADITERKGAEKALQASEERNRLLVENANEAITVVQDAVLRFVNPKFSQLTGYGENELVGKPFVELVHADDQEMLADYYVRRLKGEEVPQTYQFKFIDKAGDARWAEINAVSFDWEGRPATLGLLSDITERKKAQEAIEQSESKYKRLFESTQTAIEVISMETGLVVLANEATARMFGFASPDDLVGIDSMDFLRPEDREFVAKGMAQAIEDRSWHEIAELRVRTNDGRWLWISGMAVQSEYQGKQALLVSLLDITSRKQAEETLRESERKYRLLAEKTNDIIWTSDINLRTTYVSPSVERVLGFTPEDRLKQDVTQQMTPESLARAQEALLEHLALEEVPNADPQRVLRMELEYYRTDGSTVWLENQVSGIRDDNGTLIGFHGVARDITERRKAEQALKESEERYRLLAQNASDIIWVIDAGLKITYVSPSAASLLGYSVEELMTVSFDKALTPESLAKVAQVYMDDLVGENSTPGSIGQRIVEIEAVCKDGSTVWLETVTRPIRDVAGRLTGFHGACRDITKRRKAEESMKASEIKYRALFDHTLLGTEVVDAETGKVVLANRSIARMFGFKSPEDMIGTKPIDYVLPEDLEWVAQQMAQVFADPEKHDVVRIRARTEDGRIIWVTGSGTSFEHEGKWSMLLSLVDITAAKVVQDQLSESEEKNRLLIDNAAEAIVVVQDGVTKFFNRRLAELTGWPAEDLFAKSFLDLVHPDDREMVALNYMKRVAGEPVPNNYQFRIIDKEDNTRWLQANAVRLSWEGKPATLTMLSEVTERVNAEQALRDSEERFRALIEKATDAVAVVDQTGKVLYYSPSLEHVTGYGLDEWLGKPFGAWNIHPDDLASMAVHLEEVLKEPGKALEGIRARYQHKDGSWHTMEATVRNLIDDQKVNGIVANFRDITERVKAEESLRGSEERFRGLVETTSDWVWEIDRNSRYTYVSPRVRDILGFEPEELLGHTPFEFMHQREGRRVSKILRRFSAEHLPFSLLENTCTHKDGHSVVLETSAVPIIGSDGSFLGYRGIDRDITERKKVEQELQRSLKRLEKTMESTIEAITTTIETRDPYTTGHQMRVTDLACAIAKIMEVPPTQIEGIRVAGLLHDIGKIAIPTEILSKPGKLNEVEYEMIKTHAKVGYNILKKIEFPWPVARTVLQHHERWNGSGYPHGIRSEDILLEARILAVADVMEAMSSHRPYRPSIGADKALDEISKNRGILYDPAVADACITAFTQAGFKFASSSPGVAAEPESTSASHPVPYLEDH